MIHGARPIRLLGVYIEKRWLDEEFNFIRATIFDPGDVPFQNPNYRGTWSSSVTYAVGDMVNVTTNALVLQLQAVQIRTAGSE